MGQGRPAEPVELEAAEPDAARRMLLCAEPAELYRVPGRALIATVLETWLTRQTATPFELLHRPDLVDRLERAGSELQHAIQKVAVPAAIAREVTVHEIVRQLQRLTDRAAARLRTDFKAGALASFTVETFAEACEDLRRDGDAEYKLGAGVAAHIAQGESWSGKIDRLLDLADAAPLDEPARGLAFAVLEQPLRETLRSRPAQAELLGGAQDLGGALIGLTALAHGPVMDAVSQVQPAFAALRPDLPPVTARLALCLADGRFIGARQDICDQILHEFGSRRRLREGDGVSEIDCFRMLAVSLTAASGPFMPVEDVRAAVVVRSGLMVEQHLLDALLADADTPAAELLRLVGLLENVAGDANRRRALQILSGALATRRLEDVAAEAPEAALADLAQVYRRTQRAGSGIAGVDDFLAAVGELGGRIEAGGRIVSGVADSLGRRERKIATLERMASAETAPPGPAVERAAAALKKIP